MRLLLGLPAEKPIFEIRTRSVSIFQKAPPAFLRRRWLSASNSSSDNLNKDPVTGKPVQLRVVFFLEI